jgi:hypothetical protein
MLNYAFLYKSAQLFSKDIISFFMPATEVESELSRTIIDPFKIKITLYHVPINTPSLNKMPQKELFPFLGPPLL